MLRSLKQAREASTLFPFPYLTQYIPFLLVLSCLRAVLCFPYLRLLVELVDNGMGVATCGGGTEARGVLFIYTRDLAGLEYYCIMTYPASQSFRIFGASAAR